MVVSSPIKDVKTIEQIKSIYAGKNEFTNLLLFLLAINTGINLKDLLNLNIKNIRNKQFISIENKKAIPLNSEIKTLVEKITADKDDDEPLFTGYKGNRLERSTVFYKFKDVCTELALGEEINVSSWRKTFGYHYYQRYKDLSYLQWFFNQTGVEETLKFIDVKENMNLRFKEGILL